MVHLSTHSLPTHQMSQYSQRFRMIYAIIEAGKDIRLDTTANHNLQHVAQLLRTQVPPPTSIAATGFGMPHKLDSCCTRLVQWDVAHNMAGMQGSLELCFKVR